MWIDVSSSFNSFQPVQFRRSTGVTPFVLYLSFMYSTFQYLVSSKKYRLPNGWTPVALYLALCKQYFAICQYQSFDSSLNSFPNNATLQSLTCYGRLGWGFPP